MPTTKPRINITLPEYLDVALNILSQRDNVPKATKAAELLKTAIEMDEDDVLNKITKQRDTKDAKFVSHNKAWTK